MTVTSQTDPPVVVPPAQPAESAHPVESVAPVAPGTSVASATPPRPSHVDRLRALPVVRALLEQSLTGAGGILLAALLVAPGLVVDLATDATVGTPTTVAFVLAVVATALVVRRQSMGTAAVLPPLLYAGAVGALAWFSGNNEGSRELVLDTGTTLALAAPVLFTGTGLALLVVLGRLLWSLARR